MRAAHLLATQCLPKHSHRFSRHDFTLPQLFACLVVRGHQKKSFRGAQALLIDCPDWLADIGMSRAPGHNTLWRAFKLLARPDRLNSMLDQMARRARRRRLIKGRVKPIALDSSLFESRHVSRHFERRQKQTAGERRKSRKNRAKMANRRRARVVRGLPKLSLAVATASHFILAARATTGGGADQAHFAPLLRHARRRATISTAVADAGYDSEANHVAARRDLGVRSIIPPYAGRPGVNPPTGRHRRNMHYRFKRQADKAQYGQRWQAETVNSMIKRNLGSALRARTAPRRRNELLLRVITHDLMILQNE
jgi:hypothetical protein